MKITEKELHERIMALREKMSIVEAAYAAGDTTSQANLDKAEADKAARAQANPSWWDKLTGTMATAPEQAAVVKDKASTEKEGRVRRKEEEASKASNFGKCIFLFLFF